MDFEPGSVSIVNTRLALRAPVAPGLKTTSTVQLLPDAIVLPEQEPVDLWNSCLYCSLAMATDLICKSTPPLPVILTVFDAETTPKLRLPKSTLAGLKLPAGSRVAR